MNCKCKSKLTGEFEINNKQCTTCFSLECLNERQSLEEYKNDSNRKHNTK